MYTILTRQNRAISTGSSDANTLTLEFIVHGQNKLYLIQICNLDDIKKQQNTNKNYDKSMHFDP